MFCYETQGASVKTGDFGPFDPLKVNAVRQYLKHYENQLVLTFFSNNGTIAEKAQAHAELKICARKMKYWERQPHFDAAQAGAAVERLNKKARL